MGQALQAAVLPLQYDNYIFDLYGTLVDIHTDENAPGLWEKLTLLFGYDGASYTPQELSGRYAALVRAAEKRLKKEQTARYSYEASPEIELTDVFVRLYEEKGVSADVGLAARTGQFFRALSTEYVRLYPGAKALLTALRAQGKRVYLLSNAQHLFTACELRMLGITECFDDIFLSSDYRTKKPDPRFFELLMQKHSLRAADSLYIGNDSRCDVKGAKRVGLFVFYVHSNLSPEGDEPGAADYVVEDFSEWARLPQTP